VWLSGGPGFSQACRLSSNIQITPSADRAVRVLHRGRVRSREKIVELVPERRFAYTLLGGLPLRDYRATVDLTPERGGTTIRWSSSFRAKMPGTGWLYRAVLDRFIGQAARALADRAAEVAAAGGSAGGDGPASG